MSAAAKWIVQSWAGRRQSAGPDGFSSVGGGSGGSGAGSSTRLVDPTGPGTATSTPRFVSGATSNGADLDEIAIVSNAVQGGGHVKYGAGNATGTINGPRYVPGIITSGGARFVGERLSASGSRLHSASPVQSSAGVGQGHRTSSESVAALAGLVARSGRSVSGQNLLDLVGHRISGGPVGSRGQRQPQPYFSCSRDSLTAPVHRPGGVGAAAPASASELDLPRKVRRREIRGRLRLPPSVADGCGDTRASGFGGSGSGSTLLPRGSCAGVGDPTRGLNVSRGRLGPGVTPVSTPGHGSRGPPPVHWSFVFDPAGRLCYYWSMVVSLAFLYNFWAIIYRFAFQEINRHSIVVWFCLDYLADFLYVADIVFHFRTGYLEDGVLQTDAAKLRHHYMNSTTFYIDCLCLLPLDFLYLSIGFNSMLRGFRLVKIYRFWAFMDRTERHTNYPNLFRSTSLIHYLLVIFHWNGCLYHIVYKNNGFGSKNWVFADTDSDDVVKQYLQSYYWCTLALTTIGDLPRPRSKGEYMFVIAQLLFGLLLFATVLGHVANIVTSVSMARKEFQAKLDGVKTYMRMRRVPGQLQAKVIKWFDYLWLTQKCSDEEKAVSCLPDKLKAEIAINVHLDTLKRVEIFQNTEAGFLRELVLRLRPVLFSPGDYICRKGEVGKEMYIVNRGRLQVVADNGNTVLATLKAGSYFGEISILNMGTAGNRRTASVRSVGYSDLFVLSKKDMWDVLKEYPAARVRLEAIAVKRLEKYKRAPLEKGSKGVCAAAMGRCQSAPGLLESRGRVPLEEMWVSPTDPTTNRPPVPVSTAQTVSSGPEANTSPTQTLTGFDWSRPLQPLGVTSAPVGGTDSPTSVNSSSENGPRTISGAPTSGTAIFLSPTCTRDPPNITFGILGATCNSMSQLAESRTSRSGSVVASRTTQDDEFTAEIKRLRERVVALEAEKSALSEQLHQQRLEVEQRFAEIEMQICGASSAGSSAADDRESFI